MEFGATKSTTHSESQTDVGLFPLSQRSSCWRLRFWHHFFLQESAKAQLPSVDQDLDDSTPKRAPLGMESLEVWRLVRQKLSTVPMWALNSSGVFARRVQHLPQKGAPAWSVFFFRFCSLLRCGVMEYLLSYICLRLEKASSFPV